MLADRIQLQQVILNLLLNGMEAMRTVTDRPRELIVRSQQAEAAAIRVAVQDTGVGIDPQDLERIFTAFVTTKPAGLGMGLSIRSRLMAIPMASGVVSRFRRLRRPSDASSAASNCRQKSAGRSGGMASQ